MRPFRESVLTIVLLGITVDNLSGSPLFLYVTVYVWLVFAVHLILRVAQVGTHLRLTALVTFGVLFENIILTGFFLSIEPTVKITYSQITNFILQLIWAALTGALLVMTFEKLYKKTVERLGKFIIEHTDKSSNHAIDS
jgi:cell shape-determining protein MreD